MPMPLHMRPQYPVHRMVYPNHNIPHQPTAAHFQPTHMQIPGAAAIFSSLPNQLAPQQIITSNPIQQPLYNKSVNSSYTPQHPHTYPKRGPSKAIKIVDPNTNKEVDIHNVSQNPTSSTVTPTLSSTLTSTTTSTSVVSSVSVSSTPNPLIAKQFHDMVHGVVNPTATLPPSITTSSVNQPSPNAIISIPPSQEFESSVSLVPIPVPENVTISNEQDNSNDISSKQQIVELDKPVNPVSTIVDEKIPPKNVSQECLESETISESKPVTTPLVESQTTPVETTSLLETETNSKDIKESSDIPLVSSEGKTSDEDTLTSDVTERHDVSSQPSSLTKLPVVDPTLQIEVKDEINTESQSTDQSKELNKDLESLSQTDKLSSEEEVG